MNSGLFQFLWTNVALRIQNTTGQMISALLTWVGPTFQYCVVAYLVIVLLIASWSSDEAAFQRFFRQIWLAVVIYTLATNVEAFDYYVQGLVTGITSGITTAIAGTFGGNGNVTANSFDNISAKMFAAGLTVLKQLSWSSPVKSGLLGLAVVVYWFVSLGATFLIFIEFVASSVVTGFVVAFGPLFVACYFFPFARMFFDGWLRCVVAGMLTQIFIVGWLAMFIVSLQGIMQTMQASVASVSGSSIDDVATEIFTLILAGFLIGIFSAMTTISALLAIRISNGFHALPGVGRLPSGANSETRQISHQEQRLLAFDGAFGGGSGSNAGPGTQNADRTYAFQRTVGSAP